MREVKKIIRQGLYVITSLFIGYCVYLSIHYVYSAHEIDTGIIISKSNDEVAIKHGSRTQLFLNIQFDKKGFESVEVLPTTYFKYKVGERVCINFQDNEPIIATGFISFWILIVCIVYFFFVWVFFGEFWKWK